MRIGSPDNTPTAFHLKRRLSVFDKGNRTRATTWPVTMSDEDDGRHYSTTVQPCLVALLTTQPTHIPELLTAMDSVYTFASTFTSLTVPTAVEVADVPVDMDQASKGCNYCVIA
jgi:hypothetical protein